MGPGVRRDDNRNYFTISNCRGSHNVNSRQQCDRDQRQQNQPGQTT